VPDAVAAVTLEGLGKSFPGTRALDGVDLTVQSGEVHAVIGENGAGKSTLLLVLAGVHAPDAGRLLVCGEPVAFAGPRDAQRAGIGTVFQDLSLIDGLSVAENVLAGRPPGRLGLVDRRRMAAEAARLLALVGADLPPDARVGSLGLGARQLVEIAKALSLDARVLLLDEPTSTLSRAEAAALFGVLDRLRRHGVAILFVSHRLHEVLEIADRVSVLRDGRLVGTWPRAAIDIDLAVRSMVGRPLGELYPTRTGTAGPPGLQARGLARAGLGPVDLDVRAGEIVGLAGLEGAGRTRLLRLLGGADRPEAGELRVHGRPVRLGTPWRAARAGVALVPADRQREGVFPTMTLRRNLVAGTLPQVSRFGFVRARAERRLAARLVTEVGVRAADLDQPMATLSGGNQQKAVLARFLARRPRVLLVDEPTRGVDVGARADLHHLLRRVADGGTAVLLASSDLPELLGVADRIAVMADGRLSAVLDAGAATEEAVMAAAVPRSGHA
jgi:ABC-type sugar transport system ATPase subunit